MRLVRFDRGDGPELGIQKKDGVTSLSDLVPEAPRDMVALIAEWERWTKVVSAADAQMATPVTSVRLLAPIPRPGKILCIGLNYLDHIEEAGMEKPTDQVWFVKPVTTISDPDGVIALPVVSDQLDYEAELVTVIGRAVRRAGREEARAAIFGYCAGNDVSVRDWQLRTSQFTLGKGFDTHAPIGPCIVTADALDASALDIVCRVNGELRQSSNTRHLLFDPIDQIVHLSQVMTLEPGDLLFSGTPGGVGAASKPPRWLRDGDVVEVEIQDVGVLRSRVRPE